VEILRKGGERDNARRGGAGTGNPRRGRAERYRHRWGKRACGEKIFGWVKGTPGEGSTWVPFTSRRGDGLVWARGLRPEKGKKEGRKQGEKGPQRGVEKDAPPLVGEKKESLKNPQGKGRVARGEEPVHSGGKQPAGGGNLKRAVSEKPELQYQRKKNIRSGGEDIFTRTPAQEKGNERKSLLELRTKRNIRIQKRKKKNQKEWEIGGFVFWGKSPTKRCRNEREGRLRLPEKNKKNSIT